MADDAPQMPPPGERPQRAEDPTPDPTPDPHRTDPLPESEEGMRPGVDPSVRPHQDEPLGPATGLVTAAGTEAKEEAAKVSNDDDAESEALLARMGVEEEGIESGQLLGLIAGVLFGVAAIAVVLIYLFYIPFRTQVGVNAEASATNYEARTLTTDARAKLAQYSRTDSTYGLPIGRAMGLVAAEYGSRSPAAAAAVPATRQGWNTLFLEQRAVGAVRPLATADLAPPTLDVDVPVDARERVGVDTPTETVERVENDGQLFDGDDAEVFTDDQDE